MLRRAALAGALIFSVSCNKSEGGDSPAAAAGSAAGSGKAASSGGSFSADLATELGAGPAKGSGAAGKTGDPAGPGSDARSGGAASDPKAVAAGTPAADPGTGDAKPGGDPKAVAAGTPAADPRPGDAKPGDAKPGDARPGDAKPGDAKPGDAKPGSAATGAKPDPGGKPATPVAATGARPASAEPAGKPGAGGTASATGAAEPSTSAAGAPGHAPVKLSADLAAIKLSLLPNWDRDIDQPGTFQYVVRIKGTQTTKTFTFRYGYEDPRAPADRDQYKKYLQETRALTGELRDRQRGAAWFLEGSDEAGMPAFRYVVLYGGKRLICYGSLYKDADSSRLGDDRDQTLIQAKQICETLAL